MKEDDISKLDNLRDQQAIVNKFNIDDVSKNI